MLNLSRSMAARTQANLSFASLYSTISGLGRRDWRTGGHPAPQSVSSYCEDIHETEAEESSDPSTSHSPPPFKRRPPKGSTPREWSAHRAALKKAFPQGWAPPRKLSRAAMDGLRAMHAMEPDTYTTVVLAERFRISPEAVRRILKSKWEPTREQRARMAERERKSREQWIIERRKEESRLQAEHEKVNPRPKVVRQRANDRLSLT